MRHLTGRVLSHALRRAPHRIASDRYRNLG